jgi:ribosomal protein S18 acetylase RimI-like enzyme
MTNGPERLLGRDGLGDAVERLRAAVDPWKAVAGWATVELDRAEREVPELAARGPAWAQPRPDDPLLGARCRILQFRGDFDILLLEPSTEGRLAASLVRFGEGTVALYLLAGADAFRRARAAGFALSGSAEGPLGQERAVTGGPAWGPHLLLVAAERPPADPPPPGYHRAMTDQTSVELRPATADDADAIAALFTEEGYPAGPSDIVERLERFSSPYSRVIVADLGGEVLGFIALHAMPRFEHDDRIVRILALVVDPAARERGVGHRLMAEAEVAGRKLGAAFIEVTSGHHRPEARRLYETLGYDGTVAAYLRKRL